MTMISTVARHGFFDRPARVVKALTTVRMRSQLKHVVKLVGSVQLRTNGNNIFIFSTPRSGSTWLMELILSQPGFRACDQPLDIRNPYVRRHLGISTWGDLYQRDAEARLGPYLQRICDGRIRGLTTLGPPHRLVTRRLVFKIQNGWQERIGWVRDTLGGRIVLLIRHPIAVTLSRKELPRLEAFINSEYARHFDHGILRSSKAIIQHGSFFEKGILHWCFENMVPLRMAESDWTIISYEEMVAEPGSVLKELSVELNLPDVGRMNDGLHVASRVISKSTAETRALVESQERRRLLTKWRNQVTDQNEQRAFEIIKAFGIDSYEYGRDMPTERYLVKPRACTESDGRPDGQKEDGVAPKLRRSGASSA